MKEQKENSTADETRWTQMDADGRRWTQMDADELDQLMNEALSSKSSSQRVLTGDLYRSASSMEDVDSAMWAYLCGLIPEVERAFRVRKSEMLNRISPQLRTFYLTRGFDWERGSGGLESCLMQAPEDDDLLLEETITAYETLGAFDHAAIIRELIPEARERLKMINEAGARGEEFNYDDGFWAPYEQRWNTATVEFNFYDVIWRDIQAHPEKYTHQR